MDRTTHPPPLTVAQAKARLAESGVELETEFRRSARWAVLAAAAAGLIAGRSGLRHGPRRLASLTGLISSTTALIPVVQSILPVVTELIATKRQQSRPADDLPQPPAP